MSFYQPSLSLHDILDALSTQAALRNQQERPNDRRSQYRGDYGRPGNGGNVQNAYFQSPYYHAERPQTAYYRPSYYAEDPYETPQYIDLGNSRNVQQRQQYPDYLPEILRAFIDPREAQAQAEDEPEESQDVDEPRENVEASFNPLLAALAGKPLSQSDVEASRKGPETEVAEPTPTSESNDAVKAAASLNVPSTDAVRSEAPSPIPEPLQVSKPQTRRGLPFSPEVNVYDTTDAYMVVMALPGANSKAFRIDYHPSSHELLIKGSLDKKFDFETKSLRVSELKTGKFERSIKLPVVPRIKDEEIKATYSNGLLQVKIPKILNDEAQHPPKRRIVIESVPDEELEFEQHPNPEMPL
ncbi:LANO_0G08570g1_1 [Lachancea nothofagi CBS 11611]|uniref:LANO_0G08570g1_1 n=1 Tax=Lachancea nothofagi CBS 11611 TaxID=1266666 RepID=A0A1G4KI46_9SACH|nr:LANO_0G08570g1_1 [Lachancea nothofagi CBS 11611]